MYEPEEPIEEPRSNSFWKALRPLGLAVVLVLGFWLGLKLGERRIVDAPLGRKERRSQSTAEGVAKVRELLRYIEQDYVDTLNQTEFIDQAITSIIQTLDPHSAYIPASDFAELNDPLNGNFDGIGIEFNLLGDTIFVVAAISGGPSETVGIKAGDRIVSVNGESLSGKRITNSDVIKKLRGPGGTKVRVQIIRGGISKPLSFTITRGKIPIYSIDAAYMAVPGTGYIKISRFAMETDNEFYDAAEKLLSQGMTQLILDLRGNPGGFLNAATGIADEFLPEGKLIVFTKGRNRSREDYVAHPNGLLEKMPVTVLIDEGSASASEILAGAIQDNDRGLVIGRRSFGKGLVQEQSPFSDGSAIRLTVARYYTPTGRCIQKPYRLGENDSYNEEESDRFLHGELFSKDSIRFNDSLKYKTPGGKIVYGGGGIMPDVFVPLDSNIMKTLTLRASLSNELSQFALTWADRNRAMLMKKFPSGNGFARNENVSTLCWQDFEAFLKRDKPDVRTPSNFKTKEELKTILKAFVGRNIWRGSVYWETTNLADPIMVEALKSR